MQALVDIVKHGLVDENQKVKTITSLTISALAEAAAPYGIESFDDVLEPLWKGIRLLRGKVRRTLLSCKTGYCGLEYSIAIFCWSRELNLQGDQPDLPVSILGGGMDVPLVSLNCIANTTVSLPSQWALLVTSAGPGSSRGIPQFKAKSIFH